MLEDISHLPSWLILVFFVLILVILIILIKSKTNLTLGRLSIETRKEISKQSDKNIRESLLNEKRTYEPFMNSIEMYIYNVFLNKLKDLTLEEKWTLRHATEELVGKLKYRLLEDLIINNFDELNAEELEIYINNKTNVYYSLILNFIIKNDDTILPYRNISVCTACIDKNKLKSYYTLIYKKVLECRNSLKMKKGEN